MRMTESPEEFLAGIDRIDWSATWDAYGPATKVPQRLRALASPDPEKQDAALDDLCYTIYHQGSVYPASAEAVPFLAEMLRSPRLRRKRPVLELVQLLARGSSYVEAHANLQLFKDAVARDPSFAAKLQAERESVPMLQSRIREHVPTYLQLLHDEDLDVRLEATSLLRLLDDQVEQTAPALEALARYDTHPVARANALIALSRLAPARARPVLKKTLEQDREPLPQAVALTWLVTVEPECATPDQIQTLLTLLTDSPQALRDQYGQLTCAGSFENDLATTISAASPDSARRALAFLINRLQGREYLPDEQLITLLYVAERADGPFKGAARLTPSQVKAVKIVSKVAWPQPNQTMVNAVDVLRAFGLPDDQKALRSLLSGRKETSEPMPVPAEITRDVRTKSAEPTTPAPARRRWYEFWRR